MIIQIDLDGSLTGTADNIISYGNKNAEVDNLMFFEGPDDYSPEKYQYIPSTSGVFDPDGFALKINSSNSFNPEKRKDNIYKMYDYMFFLFQNGEITEAAYNKFVSESTANAIGYTNGGSRLITWIKTVEENGYNASNTGFKTDLDYRGEQVEGEYPRANHILEILQDL